MQKGKTMSGTATTVAGYLARVPRARIAANAARQAKAGRRPKTTTTPRRRPVKGG